MLSLVMTIALVIGLATASSGQVLADSTTEDQKLTATERADNDRFGFSVDIDGDTMVVGAPFTDTLATDSGSAFVFVRSGDSWTQQAELIRENNRPDFDRFGESVAISGDTTSVAFQSRLGPRPWIAPYTDKVLPELAATGTKRLAVFCPSFVSDCLETLEEIGIRLREQWTELGGEALWLSPCPNGDPRFARAVAEWIRREA